MNGKKLEKIDSADLKMIRERYSLNGGVTVRGMLTLIDAVQVVFCEKNGLTLRDSETELSERIKQFKKALEA
ncbi:hypothetical protein [Polynucleobacter sp.]|uniref:hypothetical protein n=1 Tax=Polynucleobacter sp. TaxID=2029855 RepID=UPI003F6983FC